MYPVVKRFFDILFSGITILLLSPLLVPVIIGLRMSGEGHIWYFQERIGYQNRAFNIWKFATMLKDSPNMAGGLITLKRDPRLTPMGGFLRKWKINELPQLFNILIGEMSFVGPRPVMFKSFEQYPEPVKAVIYQSKPGLTGIGSVIFRDEELLITKVKDAGGDTWEYYKHTIYPFKGQLEIWYFHNKSFWTDFKIILLTALAIFSPDNQLVYRMFPQLPRRPF